MARDYVDLGATPSDENCAQLGAENYDEQARFECAQYIEQLHREFPVPLGLIGSCGYVVRRHAHDFGTYFEVALRFDPDDDEACIFADQMEGNAPAHWDAPAADALADRFYLVRRGPHITPEEVK